MRSRRIPNPYSAYPAWPGILSMRYLSFLFQMQPGCASARAPAPAQPLWALMLRGIAGRVKPRGRGRKSRSGTPPQRCHPEGSSRTIPNPILLARPGREFSPCAISASCFRCSWNSALARSRAGCHTTRGSLCGDLDTPFPAAFPTRRSLSTRSSQNRV